MGLPMLNIWIAINTYARAVEPKNTDTSLSLMSLAFSFCYS